MFVSCGALMRDLIDRLARLGPLPDDAAISQAQLDEFSDIIDGIDRAPPDTGSIRPLLNTFGYGDGFGVLFTEILSSKNPETTV